MNVFKHSNPALHPDDWGVNITFIDNQLISGQANAIYIGSVRIWSNLFNRTFCWKGLRVGRNCISQLSSGPAYINYTGPLYYTINPDDNLANVNLTVHDIWGHDITDPRMVLIEFASNYFCIHIMTNQVHCYHKY